MRLTGNEMVYKCEGFPLLNYHGQEVITCESGRSITYNTARVNSLRYPACDSYYPTDDGMEAYFKAKANILPKIYNYGRVITAYELFLMICRFQAIYTTFKTYNELMGQWLTHNQMEHFKNEAGEVMARYTAR